MEQTFSEDDYRNGLETSYKKIVETFLPFYHISLLHTGWWC